MSVHGVGFGLGIMAREFLPGVCMCSRSSNGERHMHALARIDNDKSSPVRLVLSRLMLFWSSFVETMCADDPASPALIIMQWPVKVIYISNC